ncbi:accessory Sec system glycosyltransferase Asp1 [Lactovum odontotermitis]
MNYFLNENIFTLNSGTEFSAIKRLQLFKKNGQSAQILTRNYNTNSMTDIERAGLEPSDVLNMYDYFQEVANQPEIDVNIRYTSVIDKNLYHIEGLDSNESLIKHYGRTIAKSATVGLINSIDWYNDNMVVVARDIWDRRGFKSSTQYFHPDGSQGPQIFFNANGQPKIELMHMNINGALASTCWKLLGYQGKVWSFNTEEDFFAFFASELAKKESSSFICDCPSLTGALLKIEGAAGKWQYLHNIHDTIDYQAALSRIADKVDGLIVPTRQQREEIQRHYKFKLLLVLPDTYAEKAAESPPLSQQREQTIVCLGPVASNKCSIDAVDVLAMVHEKLPLVRLSYYGYASPADYGQQLEKRVKELGLDGFVDFPKYKSESALSKILPKAGVLLNISDGEAFGMSVLKGMSYGTPVIGYKVKYGLPVLITSGQEGELVPFRNLQAVAAAIVKLLSQPELQLAYSRAAYERAQAFSAEKAWQKWDSTQQLVNNLFMKV